MISDSELNRRLDFLRAAEGLKDTLRSGNTSAGRRESTAEHSWRLALSAMTFADAMGDVDLLKLLKICILHDLGEAIKGDIPAPEQDPDAPKSDAERADFAALIRPLPEAVKSEFLSLWDEYENASSIEARLAKGLDKIETILQHNQGNNPVEFDHAFNIDYGRSSTDFMPLTARIRALIDPDTRANARRKGDS